VIKYYLLKIDIVILCLYCLYVCVLIDNRHNLQDSKISALEILGLTETKHMFLTHTCYMHFNTNLMDGLISLMSPSMKSICNLRNVILCTMVTVFVRLLHPCFVFFTITAHLGITFYSPLTSEC